jgi:hypothetical protein
MSLSLRSLVSQPKDKWFHYQVAPGNDLARIETEEGADVSLRIKYQSQRQYRQMLAAALEKSVSRKTVSKKGLKALLTDDNAAQRAICDNLLMDWKMTVAGAHALKAECDFSGKSPSEEIPFNQDNLAVMVEHSNLAAVVNLIVDEHTNWFEFNDEKDGEGEKNSESGESGSTAAQAAESASQVT